MFRLHVDFPLTADEKQSVTSVTAFLNFIETHKQEFVDMGFGDINYRLGHDEDRQKSNYMIKNENGHVANKKSRIHLLPSESEVE